MVYKNPEILVEKLKADGWKYIPRKRSDIAVFQNKTGNKFFQVTIPLDRNLGDFEEALEIALQEIKSFEKEKENKK
jgi:hypothetical protein